MKILIFGKGGISGGIREALTEHEVNEFDRWQADVRDYFQVSGVIAYIKPDWVINCAGVSRPSATGYYSEIQTNLIGAITVASAAEDIPQIHIASVAGLYGKPGHLGYSASKAGVISMVQSLAMEGKKAWAISPGRVDTPMRERDYPQDTPGSRLEPIRVGYVVRGIMTGGVPSGTNVVIRKVGLLETISEHHTGDGWKEKLRVGEPVTI